MSDVAQSKQGVPSEVGDIWLAPGRAPAPPLAPAPAGRERHAGSGGAPRLATAWDTEARSVLMRFARSVNTEGPKS
jgi:hypothetical protein